MFTKRNCETISNTFFALDFSLIWCDAVLLGELPTFQRCYSPTKYCELPAQQQSDSFQKMNLEQHCCQNLKPYMFYDCMLLPPSHSKLKLKLGQCAT
jgi:hypothetical protein